MNLVRRVLARNKIKSARNRLAKDPSPRAYLALAQEYAILGMTAEVVRVCDEGLSVFPGSSELARFGDRARRVEREERISRLKRELTEAPRPALWQQMCEALLESGRLSRAEETANEWVQAGTEGPEARLMIARVQLERFLADRGRDQGRKVSSTIDELMKELANDARPLGLQLEFTSKIGAWKDARRCAAQLLQITPGDPNIEARFRSMDAMVDQAPSIDQALIAVERTGHLAGEAERAKNRSASGADVRPFLRSIAEEKDIHAAVYMRGSTVLVQGLKGATAERMARSIKSMVASGRKTGRRLGLGQVYQIQMEGEFGTLAIAPGELDAGAFWSLGHLQAGREAQLASLAGANAQTEQSAV